MPVENGWVAAQYSRAHSMWRRSSCGFSQAAWTVNYGETVLHLRDGLTKLKDFPKEFGGSGAEVPE